MCGWAALIAAVKYMYVWGRERGRGECGCGCGCNCVGEEGSVWMEQP